MSKQLRTLLFAGIGIVALGAILAVLLLLPNRTGEGDTSSTASSDPSISLVDKSKDAQGEAVEKPVKKVTVKISPDEEKKDEDGNVLVVARKGEECEISPNEEEEMVVQLYKDRPVSRPVIETVEALYFTASAVTLDDAIRLAVSDTVAFLEKKLELDFPDAYRLLSATCDIQISQVVNDLKTVRVRCPKFDTGIPTL